MARTGTATGAGPAERALHRRLLAGDVTAGAEIAERYLAPVTRRLLSGRAAGPDTHLIEDAACDALIDLIKQPQRYRPERLGIEAYLVMAARRDLSNAERGERRRGRHVVPLDGGAEREAVELLQAVGNDSGEDRLLDRLDARALPAEQRALARQWVAEAFPPLDRRLLTLILEGERHSAVFARLLGIQHLPAPEQEREVKRTKDRLKLRLRRLQARWARTRAADDAMIPERAGERTRSDG